VLVDIPETRYAPTPDGGYIAYKVIGEGPIDVGHVNAMATNLEVAFEYEPVASFWLELASFSRLIVHDRRGTGLSDDMGGLPNLETRAADLRAVLDAADSERAAIFGSADGGMVGALLAATHPDRVSRLIWYSASARAVRAEDWPYGEEPNEIDRLSRMAEEMWGSEAFSREWSLNPAMISSDEFLRWSAKMQRYGCAPATASRLIRLNHEYDVRDVLPALRVPTLVLDVDSSSENERRQAQATAALIPGASLRTVHGGQWLFQDGRAKLDAIREFLGVERPLIEPDRILATVLITDIVNSTRKAAELGDAAWRRLLGKHDEQVKGEIARHRGTYIHGTGDGLIATFDGPARAVRCAHAIVEALAHLGLEIRAGCHTGEIERLDGDVQGLAVHISARVAAMAGPSEVWTSSTVKDLTAGSDLTFEEVGEYDLKGVPDRWRLYRVMAERAWQAQLPG